MGQCMWVYGNHCKIINLVWHVNWPINLKPFSYLEFWKYVQLYRKFALMKVDFSIC